MNEQLSKQEQKALDKMMEKLWPEMTLPLALADRLAGLTKNELSFIRMSWNVSGASSLKKQELIAVLEQQLPSKLPDLLNKLDDSRYQVMKKIADQGGQASLLLELDQLSYFKDRGLIFSGVSNGQKLLAIPQEVLECFKAWDTAASRETVRRNTEWVKLSQGLLYYYGCLSLDELLGMVRTHAGADVQELDYVQVLSEAEWYYEGINSHEAGWAYYGVNDADKLKKEQQARADLSYYPFTKQQLVAAGEADFVDRTLSYQALVKFIKNNYKISSEEADFIVEDCVYAVQNGDAPNKILQSLQAQLKIDQLDLIKGFMDHLVTLNNTTRQWVIKGYSPNELSASRSKPAVVQKPNFFEQLASGKSNVIDMANRKKVGRNEPCPCSSGIKFKKCCGK